MVRGDAYRKEDKAQSSSSDERLSNRNCGNEEKKVTQVHVKSSHTLAKKADELKSWSQGLPAFRV